VQAKQRVVSSRRGVGMVIALVKEMLREFVGRTGLMFCGPRSVTRRFSFN
jgi:hypothetical protein